MPPPVIAAWQLPGAEHTLGCFFSLGFFARCCHAAHRVNNMRTWRTDLAVNYPGAPQRALVHGGFFYSYNSR